MSEPAVDPDPVGHGLPAMLMRGGTSKGAFFLADDLPADRAERDDLLLRIMGSPDPKQIDGVGGAHPLTSKVAIVSPSTEDGVDLDYLFLQVVVDEPVVSDAQTCGNLLAAVGPFALERALVDAGVGRTTVTIRLRNTGDIATETFPTAGSRPVYEGETSIDGVPGSAARVDIELAVGDKPLFPTGRLADRIEGIDVTLVDNGMPVAVIRAADLGIRGDEPPEALESDPALAARVERIRLIAGDLLGLGDVTEQTVPKVILVSAPRGDGALTTRAFIPKRVHTALGVLMGASVAAAALVPGSTAHDVAVLPVGDEPVVLEHPTGALASAVRVDRDDSGVRHGASVSVRTARKLFDGRVFPRPSTITTPSTRTAS